MRVEHITLLGNSLIRKTSDILPETIEHFKPFQLGQGDKRVIIPVSNNELDVHVTQAGGLAIFTLYPRKKKSPLFTCLCSFGNETAPQAYELLKQMTGRMGDSNLKKPDLPNWLYSIPLGKPTKDQAVLIGEISFYIYYSLYLGLYA